MSKLDLLPERALDLASQAGDALRTMAPKASTLLNTSMKLGAARAGAKAGMMIIRRNPAIAVATLAGAGLLWYAARRRARNAESGQGKTLEGSAKRIDARREDGEGRRAGSRTRSSGTARRSSGSRSRSSASRETRTEH